MRTSNSYQMTSGNVGRAGTKMVRTSGLRPPVFISLPLRSLIRGALVAHWRVRALVLVFWCFWTYTHDYKGPARGHSVSSIVPPIGFKPPLNLINNIGFTFVLYIKLVGTDQSLWVSGFGCCSCRPSRPAREPFFVMSARSVCV